ATDAYEGWSQAPAGHIRRGDGGPAKGTAGVTVGRPWGDGDAAGRRQGAPWRRGRPRRCAPAATRRWAGAVEHQQGLVVGEGGDRPVVAGRKGQGRPSPAADPHAPCPVCARWRRQWSASTSAIIASPTGTARMPTQGS